MERVCKNFGSGEIISLGLRTKKKYIQIAIIGFPVKCTQIMRCLVQRSLTACDDVNRQPRLLRMLRCTVFIDNIVKTTRCTNPKVVVISRHMAALTLQGSSASADWQTTKRTVRERTAFLFNNSLMSDITFVLADPDGTQVRVPAHKLVLAISSPVFEAMFYGELAEKRREIELPDTEQTDTSSGPSDQSSLLHGNSVDKKKELELPDTQSRFLLEFLRFLYCEEVSFTAESVFGILHLTQKYVVPLLADRCWSFIDENTLPCLKSDSAVSTLQHDMLSSLLQRETLQITKELDLFDAIKFWAQAKCREEDMEPTGEAIRKILAEAVHLIRFPTILPQDFVQQVVSSGILTDGESLTVHQYFSRCISAAAMKFPTTYRTGIIGTAELRECCCRPVGRTEFATPLLSDEDEDEDDSPYPLLSSYSSTSPTFGSNVGSSASKTPAPQVKPSAKPPAGQTSSGFGAASSVGQTSSALGALASSVGQTSSALGALASSVGQTSSGLGALASSVGQTSSGFGATLSPALINSLLGQKSPSAQPTGLGGPASSAGKTSSLKSKTGPTRLPVSSAPQSFTVPPGDTSCITATGFSFGALKPAAVGESSRPVAEPRHLQHVKKINESLDIMVEPRNIHLKGVLSITKAINSSSTTPGPTRSTADVQLLDGEGNQIAAKTGTFRPDGEVLREGQTAHGIAVYFDQPVLLWKSSTYTLKIKVGVDANLKLSTDLESVVKVDGLYFNFEGTSRFVQKLLFLKLD